MIVDYRPASEHGRIERLVLPPSVFDSFTSSTEECSEKKLAHLMGIALVRSHYMPSDMMCEVYADGFTRFIKIVAPKPRRRRHQKPLRNIRRRSRS